LSAPLIVALAAGSVAAGCLGLAFGTWLWRVKWDTRLLLTLLLAGMLCLGEEVVDLGLVAGAARMAMIVSAIGVPATAILVLARLSSLPPGLLRIAAVSGLGPGQRFRWIVLPLAAPAVVGGVVFGAASGVVDFLLPPAATAASRVAVLATPALAVLLSATVLLSPRRV
jgi:ABC-type sugar transport system permease subunit